MQKAIFLDRDGVINHDPGTYTSKVDDFRFLDGIFDALRKLNNEGYALVVITNQGGISRGIYSVADFMEIDTFMHQRLKAEGITVLGTLFCPHHSDIENCLCRKPKSLLVERAIARFQLSASESAMVGDKQRDVECAENAGVAGLMVPTNSTLGDYLPKLLLKARRE